MHTHFVFLFGICGVIIPARILAKGWNFMNPITTSTLNCTARPEICSLFPQTPSISLPKKEYTIGQWMDIWFEVYANVDLKESTVKIYRDARRRFTCEYPEIESMSLHEFTTFNFQARLNKLSTKYAKSTLRHIRIIYNKIYDTAVTNKICAENPIRLTTLPKKASEKVIEALSQKDQSALESILPQLPVIDQCILRFLLYTGLRMGELIQLTWQDWTKSKDCIRITDSKTKAGIRLVPLIPETRTILQYLYSKKQKHCPHIFSIGDNPVTQSHLRHICNKAAKIAEIAHLTPHILRHTFATRLIECGVDPKSVSVIIGHKNVAFTLQRYVTIDTQHIANEIQVLSTLRKMPLANQSDTLHTCGIA